MATASPFGPRCGCTNRKSSTNSSRRCEIIMRFEYTPGRDGGVGLDGDLLGRTGGAELALRLSMAATMARRFLRVIPRGSARLRAAHGDLHHQAHARDRARRTASTTARELNDAQYEAATTLDGPVLVVAGAGSGKTRTLVYPRRAPGRERRRRRARSCCSPSPARRREEMLRRAEARCVGGSCDAGRRRHVPLLRQHHAAPLRRAPFGLARALHHPRPRRQRGRDRPACAAGSASTARSGASRASRPSPRSSAWRSTRARRVADLVDDEYAAPGRATLDDILRAATRRYAEYKRERAAARLRRPAGQAARPPARARRSSRPASRGLPLRHGRRVPGHQPRCRPRSSRLLARAARQRHGGRRRRAVDLRASAAPTSATSWTSRALFPGTRVITLEENYRSTQPILDLANAIIDRAPRALHEERCSRGASRRRAPAAGAGAGRAASSRASSRQRILELREEGVPLSRDRGALPLELPLLRPRARAGARATSRSSSAAASTSSRRRT